MATEQDTIAVGHADHDDVYAKVFQLVGKTSNETYEDLAKVLPSIKDTDPAELKELAYRQRLHEIRNPPVDPLRLEYERAAAEEDVDDLSTDEGDWIDAGGNGEKEEVDEDGVPIVKLSRASSSFILDGPGDVQVDNFTPEEELQPRPAGGPAPGGPVVQHGSPPRSPALAHAEARGLMLPGGDSGYVPSVMTRRAPARSLPPSQQGAATGAAGAAAAGSAVMTLEEELAAMRARGVRLGADRGGAAAADRSGGPEAAPPQHAERKSTHSCAHANGNGHAAADGAGPRSRRASEAAPGGGASGDGAAQAGEEDDEAAEAVPEPPAAVLVPPAAPPVAARAGQGAGGGSGGGQEASCLPGECQDTSHEDAMWQSLQGVDEAALLQHMGLGDSKGCITEEGEPAPQGEESDAVGDGPGAAEHAAAAHQPAAAAPSQGGPTGQGSGCTSGGVASSAAPAAQGGGNESAAGGGGAAGQSGAGAAAGAAREGDSSALATVASGGPTFEAVEAFSLDPDFDYDNVQLTRREFPYSMLTPRWPVGQTR